MLGGGGGVGVPLVPVPGGLGSFSAGDENGLRRTVTIEWALRRFFMMRGVDLKDPGLADHITGGISTGQLFRDYFRTRKGG